MLLAPYVLPLLQPYGPCLLPVCSTKAASLPFPFLFLVNTQKPIMDSKDAALVGKQISDGSVFQESATKRSRSLIGNKLEYQEYKSENFE